MLAFWFQTTALRQYFLSAHPGMQSPRGGKMSTSNKKRNTDFLHLTNLKFLSQMKEDPVNVCSFKFIISVSCSCDNFPRHKKPSYTTVKQATYIEGYSLILPTFWSLH